jgi:hypothetical protein
LTIDDDVAVALERLRRKRNASLKELINEVLRRGLNEIDTPQKHRKPYRPRRWTWARRGFRTSTILPKFSRSSKVKGSSDSGGCESSHLRLQQQFSTAREGAELAG